EPRRDNRAHPARARVRAGPERRRRARLRHEVPAARLGVRQDARDGRGRAPAANGVRFRRRTFMSAIKSLVSAAEWGTRGNLAASSRFAALYHWDDLVFTHISARVPGPEHHFLINPYGMLFDEIAASSLVKIDLQGKKVLDSPFDINPAGFTIHSAIHAA